MLAASEPRFSTSAWLAAGAAGLAYLPSLRYGLVWDLGVLLLHTGRHERAEAELRIAARLDPNNANVRYNLALALLAGNKTQEARSEADALRRLNANLGKELDAILAGR